MKILIGPKLNKRGGIETWAKCLIIKDEAHYVNYKNLIKFISLFLQAEEISFMNLKYMVVYFPLIIFKRPENITCYLHGNELYSKLIIFIKKISFFHRINFISNSNFTKKKFKDFTGIQSNVSHPLSLNPWEDGKPKIFERIFDIVIFSRFAPRKRIPEIIKHLSKNKQNLKICILGYGEEEEKIRSEINKSNHNIKLIIEPNDHEKYNYLLRSKIFILAPKDLANAYEGFGIVYLEAMFCGLPIISTISGGNRDALMLSKFNLVINDINEINDSIPKLLDQDIDRKLIIKSVEEFFIQKPVNTSD